MKIWQFLLISILFSQLAQAELRFVDSPKGCYARKSYPCQVRVSGGSLVIERGNQILHLADQGALSFLAENEIQFLSGGAWIEGAEGLKVKISSVLGLQIKGEWFFHREKDATMLIRNLNGEAQFLSSRVFPSEAIPIGFQNWYGLIDSTGQVSRGIIRPIELKPFLKDWLAISGLSIAEMKNRVSIYRELWKDGLEMSVALYGQVVSRRIASVEERERKRAAQIEAVQRERAKLKSMYRDRNGFGELKTGH